jgi:hypothetical protein
MTRSVEITQTQFDDGSWLEDINDLLEQPRQPAPTSDGAQETANLILERFERELRT